METRDLRDAVSRYMGQAQSDLSELVAFRSIADPAQEPPEECVKAATWVARRFGELGFDDIALSETSDGSLCVHGSARGPEGAPTVLLYCHYDVQPPLGEASWRTPVWQLTEGEDGRWYGRGAADCKGNLVMHLTALRAIRNEDGTYPVNLKVIVEGSEEQGTGGLEEFVPEHADLLRADVICIADTGNAAVGVPTLTTSLRGMTGINVTLEALSGPMHSGMFGGPAPDPVAGLVAILASLHDADGNTTVDGLPNDGGWEGDGYDPARFREDAGVLDGVDLAGTGSVADLLWSRYDATVVGIDIPPVVGSTASIQASVRARISLRIPPGGTRREAEERLIAHLHSRVPWNLRFSAERVSGGDPFVGSVDGPAFESLKAGFELAYDRPVVTVGQGASIPLCNVLQDTFPQAEIMLYGVEDPKCLMHAPNESVDPTEIEHIALAEALFLRDFGRGRRG